MDRDQTVAGPTRQGGVRQSEQGRFMRFREAALFALAIAGCRVSDGTINGPGTGRAYIVSDPSGARILIDGRETGRVTPDTVPGLSGTHDITVQKDTLGAVYGFTARVQMLRPDSIVDISGPLLLRCADPLCLSNLFHYYAANRLRFATNPVGNFFVRTGQANGLIWPSVSNNSYASGAIPVFAGVTGGDTLALGIYDTGYLAGRPAPTVTQTPDEVRIEQSTWILPSADVINRATIRGIRVDEQIVSVASEDDIVIVRLVFHNISADPLYRAVDPFVPVNGVTYTDAWVGVALDPDIGVPTDDMISYDPDLNLAFAYDARFDESQYSSGFNTKPGLVGLRMLEVPDDAIVVLNGWASQGAGSADWFAGRSNERLGWNMLSGLRPFAPAHADRRIGHLPPAPGDMRVTVSAGPFRLAPGDSAAVTVAVVIAEPVPNTFTSGVLFDPGNPTDRTRTLYATAQQLFARATAASTVLTSLNAAAR